MFTSDNKKLTSKYTLHSDMHATRVRLIVRKLRINDGFLFSQTTYCNWYVHKNNCLWNSPENLITWKIINCHAVLARE